MESGKRCSYITLATNDEYAIGALILGYSLKMTGTKHELSILITEGVPHEYKNLLQRVYDNIIVVKPLYSLEQRNLDLLGRLNLGITYTKLYCWNQIQFSKCVFLDADTIVLQNIDDLFDREELSAAPDTNWPDIFNSGVFVFRPSLRTFHSLSEVASSKGSFDGGDQGLLNEYFSDWSTATLERHLPFTYNCSCWVLVNDRAVFYTRPTAWKRLGGTRVKVAHFAGLEKPWRHRMVADNEAICRAMERIDAGDTVFTTAEQTGVLALWWAVFFKRVKHQLNYGMFLSTTFEPLPPPPPPPTPQGSWDNQLQEDVLAKFNFGHQNYHPEFHDTSFDGIHNGQRVDESNQYEAFHVYSELQKPPEPEHHKYYTSRKEHYEHHQHQEHHNQMPQPRHYEHHSHSERLPKKQQERYGYQQTPSKPYSQPLEQHQEQHYLQPEPQIHQWQTDIHQGSQQWQHPEPGYVCPPLPQAQVQEESHHWHWEHQSESVSPPAPSEASPTYPLSIPPPPPPPPPPRNDKDPFFFTPKPLCKECLRELDWSRKFVDPFHREYINPMSAYISSKRVKRRAVSLWPPPSQFIRRPPPQIPPSSVAKEKTMRCNGKQAQKKERKNCLHQIQKPKSNQRRKQKKPIDKDRLVEMAKKQDHKKEKVEEKWKEKRPIEPDGSNKKAPKTFKPAEVDEEVLISEAANLNSSGMGKSTTESHVNSEKKRPRIASTNLPSKVDLVAAPAVAPFARLERSKRSASESLSLPLMSKKIPIEKVECKNAEGNTEEIPRTQANESNLVYKIDKPPIPESTLAKLNRSRDSDANNTTSVKDNSLDTSKKSRAGEKNNKIKSTQSANERESKTSTKTNTNLKVTTEEPVDPTPWLPRRISSSIDQHNTKQHSQYFCDRHLPHPPQPEWRMFAWERGEIDYMGRDRFSNILARIRTTIQKSEEDALPIGIWL